MNIHKEHPPKSGDLLAPPEWTMELLHAEGQQIAVVKCRGEPMCRLSLAAPEADQGAAPAGRQGAAVDLGVPQPEQAGVKKPALGGPQECGRGRILIQAATYSSSRRGGSCPTHRRDSALPAGKGGVHQAVTREQLEYAKNLV